MENNEEINLEPVEINPDAYEKNLFGEAPENEFASVFTRERAPTTSETLPSSAKSYPAFNIFSLTDAIGSRNKREAWVLYHKALASGMVPEEVFYKVAWQVKTMLIASKTKTAEEADMKAYPYQKAKGFLRNFKPGELEKLSSSLIKGYHEVRRGNEETETFVEKTLLSL